MTDAPQAIISSRSSELWPSLPLEAWQDTYATLHVWTQIVGKIRMAQTPLINHWWGVTLYVTARGLTTSPMPYGPRTFQMDFDFLAHELLIKVSDGSRRQIALRPCTVADFYAETKAALQSVGIDVPLWTMPVEVPKPIPFEQDTTHHSYDPEYAQRFWRILTQVERVFTEFRADFLGKVSPPHFFWGSFDFAVTRFSGRAAPIHPPTPSVADRITREAYSHEVSSAGFWPGAGLGYPAFYSYAYPTPKGFGDYAIQPAEAFYNSDMGEFLLPYEAVRSAPSPDKMLRAFLQSAYEAAADLGHWDRAALER